MLPSVLERHTLAHMPPTKFFNFEYDSEKCTHCKACYLTCPTSCLQWDDEKKEPYAPSVKRILGVKYPWEVVTSICVGYPKLKYDMPVPRSPAAVDWIT